MKIEGTSVDWNDIKDKPFKILLGNFEQVINLLIKFGFEIEKDDNGQYWLKVNCDKQKG